MKHIIKKILKEEIDDEFQWIKDTPSYELGDFLSNTEVCYNSNDNCEININENNGEFVFVLDYEEWKKYVGLYDDHVVGELFMGSKNLHRFDYNLRGELDSEEVNYLDSHLSDEQKNGFDNIIKVLTTGKMGIRDLQNDNFSNIKHFLLHPELIKIWEHFTWDYLGLLEEALERNTWVYLVDYYEKLLKDSGIGIELYDTRPSYYSSNQEIKITVPIKTLIDKKIFNLSSLIYEVSEPFVEENWYEVSYETYDFSGNEEDIEQSIKSLLDDLEEFIENNDMESYKKFFRIVKKLDFDHHGEVWIEGFGRLSLSTKKIGENTFVGVAPKIDADGINNVYIIIKDGSFRRYGQNKYTYKGIIPIGDLGQHMYNYKLEFNKE
jgi:hypothetical protein